MDQLRLSELIAGYIDYLETTETIKVCKCEWKDNIPVPGGKRVKMRGDVDFRCPVHTKEGLIIQFFQWLTDHGYSISDNELVELRDNGRSSKFGKFVRRIAGGP